MWDKKEKKDKHAKEKLIFYAIFIGILLIISFLPSKKNNSNNNSNSTSIKESVSSLKNDLTIIKLLLSNNYKFSLNIVDINGNKVYYEGVRKDNKASFYKETSDNMERYYFNGNHIYKIVLGLSNEIDYDENIDLIEPIFIEKFINQISDLDKYDENISYFDDSITVETFQEDEIIKLNVKYDDYEYHYNISEVNNITEFQ